MTIDQEIAALLAKAGPLRCLPDEEAEAMGLPALVDQINALRAQQVAQAQAAMLDEVRRTLDQAQEQQHEAEFTATASELAPRRCRPRKVAE